MHRLRMLLFFFNKIGESSDSLTRTRLNLYKFQMIDLIFLRQLASLISQREQKQHSLV
jgi:hypothetical protein